GVYDFMQSWIGIVRKQERKNGSLGSEKRRNENEESDQDGRFAGPAGGGRPRLGQTTASGQGDERQNHAQDHKRGDRIFDRTSAGDQHQDGCGVRTNKQPERPVPQERLHWSPSGLIIYGSPESPNCKD